MCRTTKMESDIFGNLWYLEMKTHLKSQKPKAWPHFTLPSLDQHIFTCDTVLQSQFFSRYGCARKSSLTFLPIKKYKHIISSPKYYLRPSLSSS